MSEVRGQKSEFEKGATFLSLSSDIWNLTSAGERRPAFEGNEKTDARTAPVGNYKYRQPSALTVLTVPLPSRWILLPRV